MASNWPPKKNVAFTMGFFIYKSDGTIIANPTLTGSNVHTDLGTTEVTNSTLAVVDSTTGLCSIALAQGTMNGDQIDGTITSSSTGAVVYTFKLMTTANTQDEIGTDVAAVHTHVADCATATAVADLHTDVGTAITNIGDMHATDLPAVKTVVDAVKVMTDKIGTITNTGGTATIGAILGDFANTNLTTRVADLHTDVADVHTDVADVHTDVGTLTTTVGAAGAGLTALGTAAELAKVPKSDSTVTWNATALASINAEVDTALNTAIPGTPTADSVNQRLVAIDALTEASGTGDLAAMKTDVAAVHTHVGTIDGHITADYGATEKTCIDLLDDAAGGLADIHTDIGTVITNVGDVHATDLPAVKTVVDAVKVQTDKLAFTVANQIDANVIDWKGTAAPAMTGDAYARLGATPPTAAAIADAVWDEVVTTGAHDTATFAGKQLLTASSSGDPWGTALPGAYGAGTAGKIVGDNINAPIGTVDTVVDAIKLKTDNLPASPAAVGSKMDIADAPTATGANALADAFLARDLGSGTNALTAANERTVRSALRTIRNKVSLVAGTMTVTTENDSTTAYTAAATGTAGADPITTIDPT
jgi:hypothetical protein